MKLTKEDYMRLPKERLAELLVERDNDVVQPIVFHRNQHQATRGEIHIRLARLLPMPILRTPMIRRGILIYTHIWREKND